MLEIGLLMKELKRNGEDFTCQLHEKNEICNKKEFDFMSLKEDLDRISAKLKKFKV